MWECHLCSLKFQHESIESHIRHNHSVEIQFHPPPVSCDTCRMEFTLIEDGFQHGLLSEQNPTGGHQLNEQSLEDHFQQLPKLWMQIRRLLLQSSYNEIDGVSICEEHPMAATNEETLKKEDMPQSSSMTNAACGKPLVSSSQERINLDDPQSNSAYSITNRKQASIHANNLHSVVSDLGRVAVHCIENGNNCPRRAFVDQKCFEADNPMSQKDPKSEMSVPFSLEIKTDGNDSENDENITEDFIIFDEKEDRQGNVEGEIEEKYELIDEDNQVKMASLHSKEEVSTAAKIEIAQEKPGEGTEERHQNEDGNQAEKKSRDRRQKLLEKRAPPTCDNCGFVPKLRNKIGIVVHVSSENGKACRRYLRKMSLPDVHELNKKLPIPKLVKVYKDDGTVFSHYKCPYCNEKKKLVHLFVRHIRRHVNFLPFWCTSCSARFVDPTALYAHEFRVHSPQFTCDICDKKVAILSVLTEHILCVHQNVKKFSCSFCDRKFGKAEQLRSHLNTKQHAGDVGQIKCDECQSRFNRADALIYHLPVHNPRFRSHICPKCGRAFSRSNYLTPHLKYCLG